MPTFRTKAIHFGLKPADTSDVPEETEVPEPLLLKVLARRGEPIRQARGILEHIPAEGEALHVLCMARFDLSDIIGVLLESQGKCEIMRIATLSYHDRNLAAMLGWLDSGAVGRLDLLTSIFFRSHKLDLWQETLTEFRQRGQRAAACHSHAKVVTLAFASGAKFTLEGSANLCGNGSGLEQLCIVNHGELHDWHGTWIDQLVTKHAASADDEAETG